jgi:uncharacterized protein YcnI
MFARTWFAVVLGCGVVLASATAHAHVSLTSGPGYAKQSQVLTFGIGHGCTGADTVKLEVAIPDSVTSVRAMPSAFGDATVNYDDAMVVKSVSWSKDKARSVDDQYYQMSIRITVPDAPFTTIYFPAKQTCRAADGKETVVEWSAIPDPNTDETSEGSEPAPALNILPVRYPGWNKFTVKADIKDLTVFNDAQIVWSGDAAYSSNPATQDQIKNEDGVSTLTEIKSGSDIWVKY